jgi:ribonucleoside-triphosphate reductase (thioredoxin)|tara:strand:- start:2113 stop:4035 length:1923 start_codon:yes stop_codon:yes gene_type:complete
MTNNYLPTEYQQFIHTSRYARFIDDEKRRESWPETVNRYVDFVSDNLDSNFKYKLNPKIKSELTNSILSLQVMPSMRALMTAGPALDRDHTAGYNCSYIPIDHVRSFDEVMYILLCGTGVGFSVERSNIEKLPVIAEEFEDTDTIIVVQDSKAGWAKSFRELVAVLYSGQVPKIDVSRVRPAGSRLKTFGGRASGPQPLINLFEFTIKTFKNAIGRKLNSLECHDIVCKVGEVVVVGGVRRSALISLSNLQDDRMRGAKTGQWWQDEGQRALSNNSAAYTSKPDMSVFINEWKSLYDSKSGERGIFNRQAAKNKAAENGRRDSEWDFGTNPCSEIILRPYQFCNLTEVVIRATDSEKDLLAKVRAATILGTFQSTFTDFKYLRKQWIQNTEEERLLGVSLTGIMDNKLTSNPNKEFLMRLRKEAVDTNKEFSKKLGIPQSTAITCVKPSGTVSQLVDSASGIHSRHSQYYIRTVRGDKKDPLTTLMIEKGMPHEPDITKPDSVVVFSFPMKAPDGCITRNDLTAIDQLETWLMYQRYWCEHKPSCTVSVREHEWLEVGAWVYEHFDEISGVSFLPHSEHVYQQAPYQDITKEEYLDAIKLMPQHIDWAELSNYEEEDNTTGSQELACSSGVCEIVDISSN